MTDVFVIFVSSVLTALIAAVMFLYFNYRKLERGIDSLHNSQGSNYRLHKDDYFELMRKHERLVEALDLIETKPTPKQYVKKGDVCT